MKKVVLIMLFIFISKISTIAAVDFGATWVTPYSIQPACLGQEYVNVGFHINWESNNASFQIQRSMDPNFSWAITGTAQFNGNISGCGTCGAGMYSVNDYGPFAPNQTWYYRAKATSHNLNIQYHDLGIYSTSIPTIVNWVSQVTNQVVVGSSPPTENSYTWFQEGRDMQGVSISLNPTEVSKIYLEQNNNKINFFTLGSTPFINIDVNVNNSGYSNLYSGSSVTSMIWQNSVTQFNGLGNYNLKVRFTDITSTIYYREYDVYVVPKSDGLYVDNYCNTMRVWKGSDPINGTPLILSEGFDAYNTKSEQYYRETGKDLVNCLLSKGFNIYIINYNLNAQSIANNAAVFQSAIRYVSSINNNRKVVASGMSMGGVINRYACAKAEGLNIPLPISKFVSIDAPQQGAVISQPFQDWRKLGLDQAAQNGFPDPFAEYAANNDAAKELLNYNAYDPLGNIHSSFYSSLNALNGDGYPHLVEKIGIAFSTNSPNPNNGQWLYVNVQNVPGNNNVGFNLSPAEQVSGSYLPQISVDPMPATDSRFWASIALSLLRSFTNPWVVITQFKNPTFIPHSSALDITNNVSKFNKVIIPAATGFHDQIPGDIIESIVNALLEKDVYIQNKNYSTTRTIIAREKIYSGNNVLALLPSGNVNVNINSQINFKAGEEISLSEGFNANQGSEFAAIIKPVECDGQIELQNRVLPGGAELQAVEPSSVTDYSQFLNDPRIKLEFSSLSHDDTYEYPQELGVFPNPTEGKVYIANARNQRLYYKLFSADNKLITEGEVLNNSIDISEYSKGLFLLNICTEKHACSYFKIVKG